MKVHSMLIHDKSSSLFMKCLIKGLSEKEGRSQSRETAIKYENTTNASALPLIQHSSSKFFSPYKIVNSQLEQIIIRFLF